MSFTLEILATDEAAVNVEDAQVHRALFVEIEVEHVLAYLAEVRTADFCLFSDTFRQCRSLVRNRCALE